jgi:hypothetical protein
MSFGYAVGDVIAVLNLLERIAIEIRNYRDAPHHFQELQAQLDIHKTTIQTVLSIEPRCVEDFAAIQRMRAIALHSGRPLQHFIDILHGKETALGHFRTRGALRSIGTRLHWSMVARKDVEELRAALLSNMLAVNVLLSTVQLYYYLKSSSTDIHGYNVLICLGRSQVQRLGPEIMDFMKGHSQRLVAYSQEIVVLQDAVNKTPILIGDLKTCFNRNQTMTHEQIQSIDRRMGHVQSRVDSLGKSFDAVVVFGQSLGGKLDQSWRRLFHTLLRLRNLIEL